MRQFFDRVYPIFRHSSAGSPSEDHSEQPSLYLPTIHDPYGPSVTDPLLSCLVVSEETLPGLDSLIALRAKNGHSPLSTHCIPLIEAPGGKLSSTQLRQLELGKWSFRGRLGAPFDWSWTLPRPHRPYVVLVTGGIGSGKSTACKYLVEQQTQLAGRHTHWHHIDCDLLGHRSYLPPAQMSRQFFDACTEKFGLELTTKHLSNRDDCVDRAQWTCFEQVVHEFGVDLVASNGQIDRKILGARVFSGETPRLQRLNELVWPEIERLCLDEIRQVQFSDLAVVVVEAAIAQEAGWQRMSHELWSFVVDESQAVERVIVRQRQRDGVAIDTPFTEGELTFARQRIQAQPSAQSRLSLSDVVLSTQFPVEVTVRAPSSLARLTLPAIPETATERSSGVPATSCAAPSAESHPQDHMGRPSTPIFRF